MIEKALLDHLLGIEEYVVHRNETGEDYDAIYIEYVLREAMESISRIRKRNHIRFLDEAKSKHASEIGEYRVVHGKRKLYDYSAVQAWNAMNNAMLVMLENKKDLENELRQNYWQPELDDSVKPLLEEKEFAYLRKRNKSSNDKDTNIESF